jgi:hypothetical protein
MVPRKLLNGPSTTGPPMAERGAASLRPVMLGRVAATSAGWVP